MMTDFYLFFVNRINKNQPLREFIKGLNLILPFSVFFTYSLCLMYSLNYERSAFIAMALIPISCFLATSAFRKLISRNRPYSKIGYKPVGEIKHDRESFPSRHATSAFVIAFAVLPSLPLVGWFLIGIATVISILRVISGLHYISDIVGGITFAYLFAFIIF